MNISKKLKAMTTSALAALLVVGGISFYISDKYNDALGYLNKTSIPSIESIYDLKTHQQNIAISLLRHILSDSRDQMNILESTIAEEEKSLKAAFAEYEKIVDSDKGKELLQKEKITVDEYFKLMPELLAFSKANNKDDAMDVAAKMANSREALAKLINEHIDLNDKNAESYAAFTNESAKRNNFISISVILISAIFIGLICYFIDRSINRSLNSISEAMNRIEKDLDFTSNVELIGNDEITKVAISLNNLQNKLKDSLNAITISANEVAKSSEQLSTASTQVAMASSQQSDSAASMAASVEEMTVSINHVSDKATDTHKLSIKSNNYVLEGETVIKQTVLDINKIAESVNDASEQIRELEESSAKISTVVSVIREVAEQTNLLALNAAIEAARAGEQGRGFAVVADEVKKLAQRTALSTKEISTMVDNIRSVSKNAVASMLQAVNLADIGVQHAGSANAAIASIGEGSKQATIMVEDITSAIKEQSQASNSIAISIENIAQMAEESSNAARNSADTALGLNNLVTDMKNIISQYKLE